MPTEPLIAILLLLIGTAIIATVAVGLFIIVGAIADLLTRAYDDHDR